MPAVVTAVVLGMLSGSVALTAPPPGYQLAWADEFDGASLNASNWGYRTDSKLWSTQKPENVSVDGGFLVITLKKERSGGKEYTGGGVVSRRAFLYGYYEARFRIHAAAGWHSAFWMQRADASGGTGPGDASLVLDVAENDSIDPNSYQLNTREWQGGLASYGGKSIATPSLAEFHVYGCEYTSEKVSYYFDGGLVQTVGIASLPKGSLNVWLTSIAAPLGNTGAVDEAKLPGHVEYDYFRYYIKS